MWKDFLVECVIVLVAGYVLLKIVFYEGFGLNLEPLIMATIPCNVLMLCCQFEFVSAFREFF